MSECNPQSFDSTSEPLVPVEQDTAQTAGQPEPEYIRSYTVFGGIDYSVYRDPVTGEEYEVGTDGEASW